jgi:hypothetical protein
MSLIAHIRWAVCPQGGICPARSGSGAKLPFRGKLLKSRIEKSIACEPQLSCFRLFAPEPDRSVILLDQIIEVFGRPDLALIAIETFAESFFCRAMRSLATVERDLMRQSTLAPESSPEKCLGGRDIPLGAKQKIDCLALVVDRTIKISPTSFDFDVGLINAPG